MPVEAVVLPILFVSIFAVLAYWIYSRQRRQRELLQAQVDLQTRILDRFDSPQEFSTFLQTEGGRRFLSGLGQERGGWRPARRIMAAVQAGLIFTCWGSASSSSPGSPASAASPTRAPSSSSSASASSPRPSPPS